jgi:hypothetical protein
VDVHETRVKALYIHSERATDKNGQTPNPVRQVNSFTLVSIKGVKEDVRYFGRAASARQVSLIDEGTIHELERQFGPIPEELIKAQIVLSGSFHLPSAIGHTLKFASGAELILSLERVPCFQMEFIAPGVQQAMGGGRQGALARVITDGVIALNDGVVIEQRAVPA